MFKVIKSVFYDERRHNIMDNSEVIISKFDGIAALSIQLTTTIQLVQCLNSPFFPPHIGAKPERAKEESRITYMRMHRTPPFLPPKSGEKPYLEVLSRFGLWRDFLNDNIQATIFAFRLIKNMPNKWNFTSSTLDDF